MTQPAAASVDFNRQHRDPLFVLEKDTASLGGISSRGTAINESGVVAGFSSLAPTVRRAAIWRDGRIKDLGTLGTLPGLNSSVVWPGLNNRGVVVGIAEMDAVDTLREEWSCTAFLLSTPGHICRGFVWDNGRMTELKPPGGNQSFATGVNDRGQVVGWGETPVRDSTCDAPQVLGFRAMVWEPNRRRQYQLRPYKDDATSAATAINERGQVVGISGRCNVAVGQFSAQHAVLWDTDSPNERPIQIPNLGGTAWHTPMAINNQGEVVGFSNPPDNGLGEFAVRAFYWRKGTRIKELGRLPGDTTSQALSINSRGQIVGVSVSPAGIPRGFFYDDGKMWNMNAIMGPAFADSVVSAQAINDQGQITGRVFDRSIGKVVMFVATPKGR